MTVYMCMGLLKFSVIYMNSGKPRTGLYTHEQKKCHVENSRFPEYILLQVIFQAAVQKQVPRHESLARCANTTLRMCTNWSVLRVQHNMKVVPVPKPATVWSVGLLQSNPSAWRLKRMNGETFLSYGLVPSQTATDKLSKRKEMRLRVGHRMQFFLTELGRVWHRPS